MAFPRDPLGIRVEAALGADPSAEPSTWSWTDVTAYVRKSLPITISRGRPDEFATTAPASCSLMVNNSDGRWVALNALGAWFPNMHKGVPLRVSVNPGSGWEIRFTGFIDSLPPRQDASGRNKYVTLTASGLLKRLGLPKAPLRSAAYRFASTVPAAEVYIPMEDAPGAQYAASGLPGRPVGVRFGGAPMPKFGAIAGPPGSANLPDVTGKASLTGNIAWTGGQSEWSVGCWIQGGETSGGSSTIPVQWSTTGTAGYWSILARWAGDGPGTPVASGQLLIWVVAMTQPGDTFALEDTVNETQISCADGEWHHVQVVAEQDGADIDVQLYVDGVGGAISTEAGQTIGQVATWAVAPTTRPGSYLGVDGVGLTSVGQLLIGSGATGGMYAAGRGWPGDTAEYRIEQICAEEDIPLVPLSSGAQLMGPQPIDTLLGILRECEATDGGILVEARTGELQYLAGEERRNRAVDMTLDWSLRQVGQPWEPTDDDQQMRNTVTASRARGAGTSATYVDEDHVATHGARPGGVSVNPYSDARLLHHAAWQVRQGTVDDLRFPRLSLNLAHPKGSLLIADWLGCDIGSRVQVANVPPEYTRDGVDVLIEGYTETIQSPRTWRVDTNCSPASPWTTGVVEDAVLGRPNTAGSHLGAAVVAGTDTTMIVATTAGPPWTTAGSFPFDVRVSGSRLTVTGIAALMLDAFNRAAVNSWGTSTSGQVWGTTATTTAFQVTGGVGQHVIPARGGSYRSNVVGLVLAEVDVQMTRLVNTAPTGDYLRHDLQFRYGSASSLYAFRVHVHPSGAIDLQFILTAGGVESPLSGVVTAPVTHSAGVSLHIRAHMLGTKMRGRVWRDGTPEPRIWHLAANDGTYLTGSVACASLLSPSNTNGLPYTVVTDNFTVHNPQVFTITQAPVNGVVKTLPAGSPVLLNTPMRAAL